LFIFHRIKGNFEVLRVMDRTKPKKEKSWVLEVFRKD